MSNKGVKSRRPDLFPDEENGKCSIVKCCAEFPGIDNHSPKRKLRKGGFSDWRHSLTQWKLEQNGKSVSALHMSSVKSNIVIEHGLHGCARIRK